MDGRVYTTKFGRPSRIPVRYGDSQPQPNSQGAPVTAGTEQGSDTWTETSGVTVAHAQAGAEIRDPSTQSRDDIQGPDNIDAETTEAEPEVADEDAIVAVRQPGVGASVPGACPEADKSVENISEVSLGRLLAPSVAKSDTTEHRAEAQRQSAVRVGESRAKRPGSSAMGSVSALANNLHRAVARDAPVPRARAAPGRRSRSLSPVGHAGPDASINVDLPTNPPRSFRLFGVSAGGSPGYRYRGASSSRPTVFVQGTPETSDSEEEPKPTRKGLGGQTSRNTQPARALSALGSMIENPAKQTAGSVVERGDENPGLLNEPQEIRIVWDSNKGANVAPSVAPPPSLKGRAKNDNNRYSSLEIESDEVIDTFVKNYDTPAEYKYVKVDNAGGATTSDSDSIPRIPAKDKGKGRAIGETGKQVRFEDPQSPRPKPPALDLSEVYARMEQEREFRERLAELEAELAREEAERKRIIEEREELMLQLALMESAREAAAAKDKEEHDKPKSDKRHKKRSAPVENPKSPAEEWKQTRPSTRRKRLKAAAETSTNVREAVVASTSAKGGEGNVSVEEIAARINAYNEMMRNRLRQSETPQRASSAIPAESSLRGSQPHEDRERPVEAPDTHPLTGSTMRSDSQPPVGQASSGTTIGKEATSPSYPSSSDSSSSSSESSSSSCDSSSSSSSSSSSDSDSDSEGGRHRHHKHSKKSKKKKTHRKKKRSRRETNEEVRRRDRRAAMKALKFQKPSTYNGVAVYDRIESWFEEVTDWRMAHGLSEFATVVAVGMLVTGKAKDWYKLNIRGHEAEWTLTRVSESLFDEVFPTNYATLIRCTFEDAKQGNNTVKEWHRYLDKLSRRVKHMTTHEFRRRFWDGASVELRKEWAKMGFDPESSLTSVEELLKEGIRIENSSGYAAAETSRKPFNSRGLRRKTTAVDANEIFFKGKNDTHQRSENRERQNPKAGASKQHQPKSAQKPAENGKAQGSERHTKGYGLTDAEMAKRRAEARCFQCNTVGHDARNCPERREAKPQHKSGSSSRKPGVYNGSLRFEGLGKPKKGGPTIELNMLYPVFESVQVVSEALKAADAKATYRDDDVKVRAGLVDLILRTYLERQLAQVEPDHEWQRHSPARKSRFAVRDLAGRIFRIRDEWHGWTENLERKTLMDPVFSVKAWCKRNDRNAPFTMNEPEDYSEYLEVPYDNGNLRETTASESSGDNGQEELLTCDADSEGGSSSNSADDEIYDESPTRIEASDSNLELEEGDVPISDDKMMSEPSGGEEELSRSDESLSWWRRGLVWGAKLCCGAGVAPTGNVDPKKGRHAGTDGKRPPPLIRCCPVQPAKRNSKPKPRAPKNKEKFWENVEDNSAVVRNDKRKIPHPVILTVYVNGRACRALVDTGAFSDFMSTTLVDNLGLERKILPQSLLLQMAVQGSRSRINAQTTVEFSYSTIKCKKTFDIINVASYDMILGTPFIWQHSILIGMNPTRMAIGSSDPKPIEGSEVHTILGAAAEAYEDQLERVREMLRKEAKELCEDAATSALPPFRAINHHIPLIDDAKVYKFRPSKCPRALEPVWREKSGEYLATGRWRVATGSNPIPLLLIQKPRKSPDDPIRLRACFDKREQNANTRKLASPLPDQTEVLERVAAHRYRTVIDGKDAYEQIRVATEDVWKTLFNTPDGLMVSLVLQQGDCNGPATYQTLMNHLFAGYIGVWMDVYLDDIMIYSDTLEDHIKHIRTVFEILKREKLFLNPKKMQFLATELEVLGHRITDDGIKMDPYKVDSIAKWPVPTCKELLASFIGAVGYLADGVHGIRIPMAVLNKLTGSTKMWRWGATEQRAFEQVQSLVETSRRKHRVPLRYGPNAPTIWLVTDASMTGAAGHICQGDNWKTAKPVAFWSGKFSSAEQAYPTHEQELLAIVESLKRFRHHLLGTNFVIVTDHERLMSLPTQKDLSRRQTRWMEVLSDFDFEIRYSPGRENILADALSRIYSKDSKETERAASEYVTSVDIDDEDDSPLKLFNLEPSVWPSRPIVMGDQVVAEYELLVAALDVRRNPARGKQRKANLLESDDEDSLRAEVGTQSPVETRHKRGRGRPRKSVPVASTKPTNLYSNEDSSSSVAPTSSDDDKQPSARRDPAKAYKRPVYDSNDEGESEMEQPNSQEIGRQSKPAEKLGNTLPRKAHPEPVVANRLPEYDPDDEGESEMDDVVLAKKVAPFYEGDNVYLSTKNLKLPKGKARKLVPKYIGPYKIAKELVAGTSYRLELPDELKTRGIHNAFHASLLRTYIPNCDTRFPGRQFEQLAAFGEADEDWEVARIKSHSGQGDETLFELEWTNGDVTWEPLYRVKGLEALVEYCEAMGVSSAAKLPTGRGKPPSDDPETFVGSLLILLSEPAGYKSSSESTTSSSFQIPLSSPSTTQTSLALITMSTPTKNQSNHRGNRRTTGPSRRIRQDTPHPYAKHVRMETPAPKEPVIPDALEAAIAVATAGTTTDVANLVRQTAKKLTNTNLKRATMLHEVKTSPDKFYQLMGLSDIVSRTTDSANSNAAKNAKGKAPPAKPNDSSVTPEAATVALVQILQNLAQLTDRALNPYYYINNEANDPARDPRLFTANMAVAADPSNPLFGFTFNNDVGIDSGTKPMEGVEEEEPAADEEDGSYEVVNGNGLEGENPTATTESTSSASSGASQPQ